MKFFFVKPAQPDYSRLPFDDIAVPVNWRRPLMVAITAGLTALLHGVVFIWYLNRPAPPAITEAVPLPSIDIALAAPNAGVPDKPVAPPSPPKPVVQPKPENKPKPKPKVKPKPVKQKAKSEIKKPVVKPETKPVETAPAVPQQAVAPPSPPAAVTPPANAQANRHAQRSPVGSDTPAHANADYLSNPKPAYPRIARQRHWEGRVVLRVFVTADGRCGDLSVYRGSGHDALDESAIAAVRNWRFVPGKRGGVAVASWVNVPIEFALE